MKNLIFIFSLLLLSCGKNEMPSPDSNSQIDDSSANMGMDFSTQKLLLEGTFVNGAHPTSGKAKIYEASDGKKTLLLENFKTDAGPDLRIYIAEDKAITNFKELSMKVENGNKSYEIPSTVDLSKQKHILIWCKQFAVLFGHSELK
ncbi:hypothetical protein EGI22_19960 [Lacihabitans sp. LS3-19]|uniref:DM13 domain-containing protein n=1 Tax=Lacihabitans sp. LS3-19 TaxID=2487335 RepID=UPI0020CD0E85|nr:DM13 domain-containing protein [Lacihabitans sp. LS3-19]MCP9770186.1 hypothetical protein [Lacihabitans sp. LS3-19]